MNVTREKWESFNLRNEIDEKIEPVVRDSWERSKNRGIDPLGIPNFVTYTEEELLEAIEKNRKLLVIIEPYVQNVLAIIHEMTGVHMTFLDSEGFILKVWTDGSMDEESKGYGISLGVCWREEFMGTNAPGIAWYLDKSIVIEGYEHYIRDYHNLSGISAPIHSPKGEILGILNISLPFENYNKSYLGMLITAVRGIERELSHIEYQKKIETLNKRLEESVEKEKRLREQLLEKAELDVTTLKNRELEMRRQREFMSKVLDIVGTPMAVVKYPELVYEISNQKNNEMVCRLIKKDETYDDLTGASIAVISALLESTSFMDKVKLVGEKKKELVFEATYYDRTGEYHNSVYSPLTDEEGNVTHVVVVNSDITNQITYNKRIEEIAKQKDEFFSIVSHELRSPTAIINSATQMLLSPYYEDELSIGARRLVSRIKQNSYRLLRLINNFLDITKMEEGFITINNENVDIIGLSRAITDSLQFLAGNKGIQLNFETKIKERIIAVDADKYERILLNLLSNAFKFTLPDHRVFVSIGKIKGYVQISVRDEGIGIPPDKLDCIFNRFVQVDSSLSRTSEGTGIGLSLVKALIEKMDGRLEVRSKKDIGSEFILFLPDKRIEKGETVLKPIKSSSEIAEVINVEFSDIYSLA